MYLAAYGARTPLLALSGLRRPRNVALVVAPYLVGVPIALLLAPRFDAAIAAGLVALAIAPAPLVGPTLVRLAGGRSDMTGALTLGTGIVSFALVALRPDTNSAALIGAQAFAGGALVANALPALRDRLLVPLRWVGDAALLVVLGVAFASATLPGVGPASLVVTVAFIVPLSVALLVALAFDRDRLSALVGVGSRDPVLAIPIGLSIYGPAAASLPLLYALMLFVGVAAALLRPRWH